MTTASIRENTVQLRHHILVIDDDEYILHAMVELLTMKDYVVKTAASVAEFRSVRKENTIDLYMVDVMLPDGSGFDICKEIRKDEDTPIIFLTSCDDEGSITKGLDLGADDYVTKPFRSGELLSRMKANLRRAEANRGDEDLKRFGNLIIDQKRFLVKKKDAEIKLSTVEFQLLTLLVNQAGLIVRREFLFEQMWDKSGNFVEDNTLTVNMSRLKSKLGLDDRTGKSYIETIRGIGYRFIE